MALWPLGLNNSTEASYHYQEPYCSVKLQAVFDELLNRFDPFAERDIIILCIGTDRSTGDALGPLTGSRLRSLGMPPSCIYGTLDEPVHATNLADTLQKICEIHREPLLVPIDACLGRVERIGHINIKSGSLTPGTAVKKNLPPVGEFHISGNVNVSGYLEHLVLQNTRLSLVVGMADVIARAVFFSLYNRRNSNLQRLKPIAHNVNDSVHLM